MFHPGSLELGLAIGRLVLNGLQIKISVRTFKMCLPPTHRRQTEFTLRAFRIDVEIV